MLCIFIPENYFGPVWKMGSDHMPIKLPFPGVSGLPFFLPTSSILAAAFCLSPVLESLIPKG